MNVQTLDATEANLNDKKALSKLIEPSVLELANMFVKGNTSQYVIMDCLAASSRALLPKLLLLDISPFIGPLHRYGAEAVADMSQTNGVDNIAAVMLLAQQDSMFRADLGMLGWGPGCSLGSVPYVCPCGTEHHAIIRVKNTGLPITVLCPMCGKVSAEAGDIYELDWDDERQQGVQQTPLSVWIPGERGPELHFAGPLVRYFAMNPDDLEHRFGCGRPRPGDKVWCGNDRPGRNGVVGNVVHEITG